MKAILATNFKALNEYILENVPDIEVIIHDIETQSEAIDHIGDTSNIDIILLTDLLRGEKGLAEFLEMIMERKEDKTKVYYIAQEYERELLKVIAAHNIKYYRKNSQTLNDFIDTILEAHKVEQGKVIVKKQIKVVKEEKIIESVIRFGFKKLVLTVWDNPEFGCELAYIAAKHTSCSVLLIDADLLAPKADLFLNIKKYPDNISSQGIFANSGLNIMLDALEKNVFNTELLYSASVKRKELKNLHILTGNYNIENYEYYSRESYLSLIERAYQNFDITILLVNRSMYDLFTVLSLLKSDYNLIPVRADMDVLREYNTQLAYLEKKQGIPLYKNKFIAYDHQQGINLDKSEVNEITEGNCIGCIRWSRKRAVYRNLKKPVIRCGDMDTRNEYMDILAYLNIVPQRTWKDKIKDGVVKAKTYLRNAYRKAWKRKVTEGGDTDADDTFTA